MTGVTVVVTRCIQPFLCLFQLDLMISEWSTIVMFQAVQDSGRAGTFVSTLAAVEFLKKHISIAR